VRDKIMVYFRTFVFQRSLVAHNALQYMNNVRRIEFGIEIPGGWNAKSPPSLVMMSSVVWFLRRASLSCQILGVGPGRQIYKRDSISITEAKLQTHMSWPTQ
jgi:hypothetical protein